MTTALWVLVGLLGMPGGDFLEVKDPPKDPAALIVDGKVTVVLVGLEGCPQCDGFNEEAAEAVKAMQKLAVRYVDGAHDNTLAYMPRYAPVPRGSMTSRASRRTQARSATACWSRR